MVKTKILLSVVIVLVIGVAAAGYQITNNTPKLWQATNPQEQISTDQNSKLTAQSQSGTTKTGSGESQTGGSNVKISATQAKSIAAKSISISGATAGTPKLSTINGKKVYIVPIVNNGKTAGEIWVDAQTGENIGGAGGAP
ncbi:MAG: PepSY domain-containing protein [Methanobacterium sp.]